MSNTLPVWRIFLFLAITFSLLPSTLSLGQDVRQRRREMIDNVLRELIESQLESRDAFDRGNRPPGRRGQVPGRPGNAPALRPGPEMLAIRGQAASLYSGCESLIGELRIREQRVPQLRPLLADAIQLGAEINVFIQRCDRFVDVARVRNEFLAIDRDWRILNHRLRQVPQIAPEVCTCLDGIGTHHQNVCEILDVKPQVDRRALARVVIELHADLRHLLRDVDYECRANPGTADLIQQGRLLQAQSESYAPLVERGTYDMMVDGYKQCRNLWRPFGHAVLQFPNDQLRHDVHHIAELGRQIEDLLWLGTEFDREYISDICLTIEDQIQQMLNSITVSDLLACKNPTAVFAAARDFHSQCNSFAQSVGNQNPYDQLCVDYRLMDRKWEAVNTLCRELERPALLRQLDEIQYTLSVMQPSFGAAPVISRDHLINIAGEMAQLSNQLQLNVHQFDAGRYAGSAYRDMCRQSLAFQEAVDRFHRVIVSRPRAKFQTHVEKCHLEWTALKQWLNKCPVEHRYEVARFRAQMDPLVAKLHLVYVLE